MSDAVGKPAPVLHPIMGPQQDIYSKEEVACIVPRLGQGKYELDIGPKGQVKLSKVMRRWCQREELEQG
jgi:hypothetical protein